MTIDPLVFERPAHMQRKHHVQRIAAPSVQCAEPRVKRFLGRWREAEGDLLQHFDQNEQQFLGGKQYAPLTSFNHQWQAQNNPQVYAAATGILNGDSFDKWRARLSSPDEGQRAAQIAARIDPNVMIPARNGGGIPARQFLQRGQ